MGSCLSTTSMNSASVGRLVAKIVTIDGSLIEYSAPAYVFQVLGPSSVSSLLCNSDNLCYNDYVHALSLDEIVELGKLYFILPIEKKDRVILAPDMAALAVKASSAIETSRRSREFVEVVPMNDGLDEYMRINEFSIGNLNTKLATSKNNGRISRFSLPREKLSRIEEVE